MNEKSVIDAMLASIKGITADEIIIVDELSTDGTRETLLAAGAKIIDGKLSGNYSALRNSAISSATKEWIFFIDSDETLEPGLIEALRSRSLLVFCEQNGYDAVALKRKNFIDGVRYDSITVPEAGNIQIYPDWQFRLFRNNGQIRYHLPIHESLTGFQKAYFSQADYHILHNKSGARQQMQNAKYAALKRGN